MKKQKLKLMKQMKEETTILKMKGQRREKYVEMDRQTDRQTDRYIEILYIDR